LSPTTLGTLAQSLVDGSKAVGLTRKTSHVKAVVSWKLERLNKPYVRADESSENLTEV
jgi:hypothetical protein